VNIDPYQVLGITKDATWHQAREAYRRLVRQLHPDLHPDDPGRFQKEERLKIINAAYEQLKDGFADPIAVKMPTSDAAKHCPNQAAKHNASNSTTSKAKRKDAEKASVRFWNAYNKMKNS
jgi:preprotein translocase subunit Sec63